MNVLRLARRAAFLIMGLAAAAQAQAQATPERTDFLPDSTVLLRVNDRVVRVKEFVETYFESWAEYRPASDSLGRVQFIKQFVDKEILASVARRANSPLQYEERQKLREYSQRAISNALFQRFVRDSVVVSDADIAALRREYSSEKHMQEIVFADLATAQRVRQELTAKKITWHDAWRRYNSSRSSPLDGDMGWVKREAIADQAFTLFDIAPGQVSQPARRGDGYHVMRVLERRDTTLPSLAANPRMLRREIATVRTAERMDRIQSRIHDEIGLALVDSNLVFVASKFPAPKPIMDSTGVVHVRRISTIPDFAAADTSRVLARWAGGQFTLEGLLQNYRETNSFARQPLNTPSLLAAYVESVVLEPYRWKLGVQMGLDKDPFAVSLIEGMREQMLVDHLYQDSVMSKVRISPAERRKYYDQHVGSYLTYASAQYAVVSTGSKNRADSIAAVIRGGKPITTIMAEDSIRFHHSVGFVRKLRSEDKGSPYFHPVMEELKPGQLSIELIPDIGYTVVQLQSFDPGHQLSFQEAEKYVDESLQNIKAQAILEDLIARYRRTMSVETHPELVMRIRLVDPTDYGI